MKTNTTLTKLFILYNGWFNHYSKIKDSTREKYIKILETFFNYLDSQNILRLKDIPEDMLWEFIHLNYGKPYAYATTVVRFSCLDLFFRWAYENKYCLNQPTLLMKKSKVKHKMLAQNKKISNVNLSDEFLSKHEQKVLISYLEKVSDGTFRSVRNKCIVLLVLNLGLTPEELADLKENAVSINKGKILRKEENGTYEITINNMSLKRALEEWRSAKSSHLKHRDYEHFLVNDNGHSLTTRRLHQIISAVITNAGITKKIKGPILLRKTAIFNAINEGKSDIEIGEAFNLKHLQINHYKRLFKH